ncbi:hypothetical protein DAPPUDRAFT_106588 [Daphnia pulex]|uniref:Huntingtin n=1 Tax=Daphnia pulex TaxID=6669 RepID=E9GU71_DAPPU|nr:hypothetical protein DAPPUDRAFT_106588 [Daphnia pulex]|eukprot:EFX77022.1 hypothetical protein DAPPUDRAFT_106588 [Daphnia pulex]
MASLERLIRALEQLQVAENSNSDNHVKKKELRTHLQNIVEFNNSLNVQNHKDFVSYIGPSIDSLIRLCDSKDSDIRLASDEGLYKVIKALLPLHSNRILVELCKQIKKSESPRILKLSMTRFAELCHLARPQKRRAYIANLFNAISTIANRKEEMLHESLSNFVCKVFNVMGIFAYENETKILLKGFLANLSSSSSIIRRCAANAITVIISSNRKSDILLALVVEYLTDQILLPDDISMTDTPVIIGTLLTLKLLLPLFQLSSNQTNENLNTKHLSVSLPKITTSLNAVALERIVQIFELGVHYSFSSDHNVVNAALELLQQLLKMRSLILAIPSLKSVNGLQGTRISLRGLSKENSQWNLTALPVAEESLLLEAEVHLGEFEKTSMDSIESDVEIAEDSIVALSVDEREDFSKSLTFNETDVLASEKELEETDVEPENCDIIDAPQYSTHDDPQLRGQVALLACMVLSNVIGGFDLTSVETRTLVRIIDETLIDKETAASRLALQGLQHFLPMALEGPFCVETVPLLRSLLKLSENPYWLVRVDLLEVFGSFSWTALEFGLQNQTNFKLPMFQECFLNKVLFTMIGDEDHRVRSAVANCLTCLMESWTIGRSPSNITRAKWLASVSGSTPQKLNVKTFAGVPLSINGLAEAYWDVSLNQNVSVNLAYFVDEIFQLLVSSNSKFVKMGCLQSLSTLSCSYPPTTYLEVYGCSSKGTCSLLKVCMALLTNSTLMLDLVTHQTLITLATQLFAGCVKAGLNEPQLEKNFKDWRFLKGPSSNTASCLLGHATRILNAFCCVLDDVNPLLVSIKVPLVTLPNPSALSPIRRKLRSTESLISDKEDKSDDSGRKNKPHLLNPSNVGFFAAQPLYVKLYDLLKSTHATCKLNFDTITSERLSNFIQSTLELLAALIEVSIFQDIGKHSEEILNYLRIIITAEPVYCLRNVQQLLKALFGANLAAVWFDEAARFKRSAISSSLQAKVKCDESIYSSCGLDELLYNSAERQMNFNRNNERPNLISKFRTSINKIGPDKTALTSYIRLFEPMVIKALKVFLNFVIQQFEFLEEGFIPQVETLLPSMFRFLSLLSYDRFHSKTIISVPRIMQLAGGLMATGKDAELHVLPTLQPMVEDLFLSRERMSDNFKELETQKEVLINLLIRLIQYHKVYPLITAVLLQVQFENANKWKSLSKQICDALIPQLNRHSLFLDSDEALQMLQKLISHMDPPVVHESLLGLLQTFTPKQSEDFNTSAAMNYHRVLACRLTVFKTLIAVFDEAFLLDCLNEFNLSYLVNQRSDPLNVTPTENSPPEHILSCLLVDTIKLALSHWKSKVVVDNCGSTSISWRIDGFSFSVHLVLDLIALCRRLLNSNDFPVLQTAILAELAREECKSPLFQVARELIPNNPIVFVRICALLLSENDHIQSENVASFGGLNGSIAQEGLFLLLSDVVPKEEEKLLKFVSLYADQILNHFNETPVKKFFGSLIHNDEKYVQPLVKCVLAKGQDLLVSSAMSLLNIIENVELANSEAILLHIISSFQTISSGIVHRRMCKLVLNANFTSSESKLRCLKNVQKMFLQSTNQRWYSEITAVPSATFENRSSILRNIDKAFVLDFALKRELEPLMWREIVAQTNTDDLPLLCTNHSFLLYALGSRILKSDVFYHAKAHFLNMVTAEAFDNSTILSIAHILSALCKSISPSEVKDIFTASEFTILAKTPLTLIGAMDSLSHSLVLLQVSSEIVSIFGRELAIEWTDKENLPAVYKAIHCLESLCIRIRNNATLEQPTITGLEQMICPDPNFVSSAKQLNRILRFIEQESNIPGILHQDLLSTVTVFCRMPLFYSYICIPLSAWSKGWNPELNLDVEHITLDLPIIPSHFLHDEVVLKEFVFRRGKKLKELCNLLEEDYTISSSCSYWLNRHSFRHIQYNIDQGSPSKKKATSPEDVTDIDIQSCVRFLVDLYSQWLQNSNTPYPLLVDLFQSLVHISNFFVDVQQFEWMLDNSLTLHRQLLPDDPASLESALVGCILKSASFIPMNMEYWELVKKHCETALNSQHISTRTSGLNGLLYLLQKFARHPDLARTGTLVNLAMDYVGKCLSPEQNGPTWHQSFVWSIAFYCGEHFAVLPYQNYAVVDFVVQCALSRLVQNEQQANEIPKEILQGLKRLSILGVLTPTWRTKVKKEVLNLIRNVDCDWILQPALRTLLSLVYSDFGSQLYKPGADPETMLAAMEWVGALFQRMKRGTDREAELLGRIMPVITCDIFPPADILNRILSEFITARPTVACCLTPTIFKVFGTARTQGQQSLVMEWILLSLSNFTRTPSDTANDSIWNILCFFTAASNNPWLQSVFPLINRPVNQNDSLVEDVFVASALDFNSQLDDQQRSTLVSIFYSAREKSSFFAAVDVALKRL